MKFILGMTVFDAENPARRGVLNSIGVRLATVIQAQPRRMFYIPLDRLRQKHHHRRHGPLLGMPAKPAKPEIIPADCPPKAIRLAAACGLTIKQVLEILSERKTA